MYKYFSTQNARVVLLFPPLLRSLAGAFGTALLVGGVAFIMARNI